MRRQSPEMIEKLKNLVVNYEGLSLTIVLALMLFVFMFTDDEIMLMQNSFLCNFYYLLSISAFMFYMLASKKISLAFDQLRGYPDPLASYWILPA